MDNQISKTSDLKNKNTKKQKSTICRSIRDYFSEFFSNTSIHGLRYLGESDRCFLEKFCWFLILCVCIYFCGSFIVLTWKKWKASPIFISFNSMHSWDIPFPAVTVCPENQVPKRKFDFTQCYNAVFNYTYEDYELKEFEAIYSHCPKAQAAHIITNRLLNSEHLDYFVEHATALRDILGPMPDAVYLRRKQETHFSPILIDGGLCFSFNSVDPSQLFTNITYVPKRDEYEKQPNISHWTVDENYFHDGNNSPNVFPMRVINSKKLLHFRLATFSGDIDESCDTERGFKIILHHPAEIPTITTRYVQAAHNFTYNIWIRPDVTTTSSALKSYSPYKRKCFYANERPLKFYKIYTQQNCKIECLANYTLKKCGCVSFYMPHEPSTSICGFREDTYCVVVAEEDLAYLQMQQENSKDDSLQKQFCDCLPSCTSITYHMEISQNTEHNLESATDYFTQLNLRFRDTNFLAIERNALFSQTDFWASCGGIFGLFIGFSVISIVEIVYFLSVRWLCNIWLHIKKHSMF